MELPFFCFVKYYVLKEPLRTWQTWSTCSRLMEKMKIQVHKDKKPTHMQWSFIVTINQTIIKAMWRRGKGSFHAKTSLRSVDSGQVRGSEMDEAVVEEGLLAGTRNGRKNSN